MARSDDFDRLRRAVDEMIARYRQRDFAGASDALVRCRQADHGSSLEGLFILYEGRIKDFRENPPPVDWDGVFVADTK
jgi:adenylate cyclase